MVPQGRSIPPVPPCPVDRISKRKTGSVYNKASAAASGTVKKLWQRSTKLLPSHLRKFKRKSLQRKIMSFTPYSRFSERIDSKLFLPLLALTCVIMFGLHLTALTAVNEAFFKWSSECEYFPTGGGASSTWAQLYNMGWLYLTASSQKSEYFITGNGVPGLSSGGEYSHRSLLVKVDVTTAVIGASTGMAHVLGIIVSSACLLQIWRLFSHAFNLKRKIFTPILWGQVVGCVSLVFIATVGFYLAAKLKLVEGIENSIANSQLLECQEINKLSGGYAFTVTSIACVVSFVSVLSLLKYYKKANSALQRCNHQILPQGSPTPTTPPPSIVDTNKSTLKTKERTNGFFQSEGGEQVASSGINV